MTRSPLDAPNWPHTLPNRPPPFPDETLESYIARLAWANSLKSTSLLAQISESRYRHPPIPVERLAAVAGRPEPKLKLALPELRYPELANRQPGRIWERYRDRGTPCEHCTVSRGIPRRTQVTVWIRVDRYVCLRHRRWVGHDSLSQFGVEVFPEILKAQVRLRRLNRRLGDHATGLAMERARRCFEENFTRTAPVPSRVRLMKWFIHEARNELPSSYPHAALFPEVVTLATFFASPYWNQQLNADLAYHQQFRRELQRLRIVETSEEVPLGIRLFLEENDAEQRRWSRAWLRRSLDEDGESFELRDLDRVFDR